jgi:hypothetical protein
LGKLFAQNPEVQELVQTQSIGLAEEVVEEVRERTVSADNFVEGIVRAVLRRPSRSQLPYPQKNCACVLSQPLLPANPLPLKLARNER